jgi:choline kinase
VIECAVLLCAGSSTRLRPLTDDRPKCLLDVGKETILARAVRLLLSVGVRELVVATGYQREQVHAALRDLGLKKTFCDNPDYATTQNSVSLLRCRDALAGRPFFKLDGDVLFHREILDRLGNDDAQLSVAVDHSGELGAEEMKVIAEDRAIRAFGKELSPAKCAGESIGIEKIEGSASKALFAGLDRAFRAGRTNLYYEDVYGELISDGLDARVVDVSDLPWIEIDTPADLAKAREQVAKGAIDLRKQ